MKTYECKNQAELDDAIKKAGKDDTIRIIGGWHRIYVSGNATVGSIYVSGNATVGSIDVYGNATVGSIDVYGWKCKGENFAESFSEGPMLDLLAACPGGVQAAAGAWGNSSWSDCPLHDALGLGEGQAASFKDVDAVVESPRLRLFARIFVDLHDRGLLDRPEVSA